MAKNIHGRSHLFPVEWSTRSAVVVEPSGVVVTYSELEERSNQVAQFLRTHGARPGDTIAILVENRAEFFEIAWGAQRSGLHYVAVNTHLALPEVEYVLRDSRPVVVFSSAAQAEIASEATPDFSPVRVMIDRPEAYCEHWLDYATAIAAQPACPISDQCEGDFLLYSSGTTGRPKGIVRPLTGTPLGTYVDRPAMWLTESLGFLSGDTFLSPAPLYHAAPLAWTMAVNRLGGTVVVMESFDAAHAVELIELHRVTHSQWVPTMFVRMLKLDPQVKSMYDLSSHRAAVHAGAPCTVDVKHAMIDWWGPQIYEFYSNTEGVGATFISPEEWLERPGSVGRPAMGTLTIVGEDRDLLPGEVGTICFSGTPSFEYRGDPGKTAATIFNDGRATVGDLGYVDEDGYLFVSGRRADLIISGGVNIYPQEVENVLIMHPAVLDVAVVGAPDNDMGETVVAFVETVEPDPNEQLAVELREFCRKSLAGIKVPRRIEFVLGVPRTPTGKLRRRDLAVDSSPKS